MFSPRPSGVVNKLPSGSNSAFTSPFHRLKPNCVELLVLGASSKYDKDRTDRAVSCLRRLRTTLESLLGPQTSTEAGLDFFLAAREPILPPSLVHYVFFPISQLISAAPEGLASIPDSLAESIFQVLKLLGTQWWYAWQKSIDTPPKEWSVWRDLLILGTSVLGTPGKTSSSLACTASNESKAAAISFLLELLRPRFYQGPADPPTASGEWEWDGVSDLPSLDDIELEHESTRGSDIPEMVFPSPEHLDFMSKDKVSKGALSFCLSSACSIADDSNRPTELRARALLLARQVLILWIGGVHILEMDGNRMANLRFVRPADEQKPAQVAERLRPLLPGIASSLTRLITSKVKFDRTSGQKDPSRGTPSLVSSIALDLLRDLMCSTLSNQSLQSVLEHAEPVLKDITQDKVDSPIAVSKLEDFAKVIDNDGNPMLSAGKGEQEVASDSSTSAQLLERWALSSLAQAKLALKSFIPMASPSIAGFASSTSSVQISLIDLATSLVLVCGTAFEWLDHQLRLIPQMDTSESYTGSEKESTVHFLLLWILDLSADTNTDRVSSHARTALISLWTSSRTSSAPTPVFSAITLQLIVADAFSQLPDAIRDQNDSTVSRLAIRLRTVFTILVQQSSTFRCTQDSLADHIIESANTWGKELVKVAKVDTFTFNADPLERSKWKLSPHFVGLDSSTADTLWEMLHSLGKFAALSSIARLQPKQSELKSRSSAAMLGPALFFVEHAIALRSLRVGPAQLLNQEQSLASFAIAAELLRGMSSVLDNIELVFVTRGGDHIKKARRSAHKFAHRVFTLVIECLDGDADEVLASARIIDASDHNNVQRSTLEPFSARKSMDVTSVETEKEDDQLVERTRGLSVATDVSSRPENFGPALDLSYLSIASVHTSGPHAGTVRAHVKSSGHQYAQAQRAIEYANAMLFSLIASCSKIMGQSFRPLMLQASYPLISGMSSSSSVLLDDVMQSASIAAFNEIAYNAAYASPKNCMMDQADYVLGGACQRLISGLEEELEFSNSNDQTNASLEAGTSDSPTGNSTVVPRSVPCTLLPLTSAQRAPFVLVEMVRTLGSEIVPMVQDAIDEILDSLDRFHPHPYIADGLLAILGSILETMAGEQSDAVGKVEAQPLLAFSEKISKRSELGQMQAWLNERKRRESGLSEDDDAAHTQADAVSDSVSSTSSDEKKKKVPHVATQILMKAVPFLTHPSPDLRCRVLDLLRHGMETLAPQGKLEDLLPIVNSAWPFVMSRLGQSYSTASNKSSMSLILDLNASLSGRGQSKYGHPRSSTLDWAELNPNVWIAASRFVATAARHLPDFIGRKIVQEAWPRFQLILDLLQTKFDPLATTMSNSKFGKIGSLSLSASSHEGREHQTGLITDEPRSPKGIEDGASRSRPFLLASPTSQTAELVLSILSTLTATINHTGSTVSDDVAWQISTHSILLGLLDDRQPINVQAAAGQLFTSLARRNADATWLVLRGAFGQTRAIGKSQETLTRTLPRFLHHNSVQVHAEVVHSILSG